MSSRVTVANLVVGRLNELRSLHQQFGGPIFFEAGQSLLSDADRLGVEGVPTSFFTYFEIVP